MKLKVSVNNKEYEVDVEDKGSGEYNVTLEGQKYEVKTNEPQSEEKVDKETSDEAGDNIVKAPMPGTIAKILVKNSDKVKKGDTLVTLVAMKMENQITATKSGTVKDIKVKENQTVESDDVLVVLE